MKMISPEFEVPQDKTLLKNSEYFEEIIEQIEIKLKDCKNFREKYLLLSVLPQSWTPYQTQKIEGVSKYVATRLKQLINERGILFSVPSKSGHGLDPHTKQMIQDFFTSDEISRCSPGQKDYVAHNVDGEKVTVS